MSERLSPDEAFALLSDGTRLDVLRALHEAPADRDPTDPTSWYPTLSFSQLRERVGMRDSGQFNYHLGKLVGHFVEQVEEGYRLTHAGYLVLGAVLAGVYTDEGEAEPVAVDEPCPVCGGTIAATYGDERMHIACRDCGERVGTSSVPPGVLEGYDPEEYPRLFDRYVRHLVDRMKAGFCIACSGRVEAELLGTDEGPMVAYRCTRCPEMASASVGEALLDHPAVVAFHHDHGVDLRETPSWELSWLLGDHAELLDDDPPRARCVVELEGDHLELVVAADATVSGVSR